MSAQVLNLNADDQRSTISSTSESSVVRAQPPPLLSRSNAVESAGSGELVPNETGDDEGTTGSDSPVIVFRNDCNNSPCNTSTSSRDSVVTMKHYDCLLGELRCPGCARPMHSPIFLCKSGHSVCELCTETLLHCPLCKQHFTEIRSVTLEALAEKAYFLCKYSVHGCTVRLPYHLMRWHKERCVYQVGDCFMGKVWGGCTWSGCEIDWIKHCTDYHAEKLFSTHTAQLVWHYRSSKAIKSVQSFYIFQAFGETFNLYHVYDKPSSRSKWTMVCASKRDEKAYKNYAFQVELFVPEDPSRLLVQRHSCHGERDDDVLEEARCVCLNMGDVMRFMGPDKTLNYRVEILDIRELRTECMAMVARTLFDEAEEEELEDEDTSADADPIKLNTDIPDIPINECTNHKRVPQENIIKRRCDISRMIATIDEEEFAEDACKGEKKKATVNTNGAIVVHSYSQNRSSMYSVCEEKSSPEKEKDCNGKDEETMNEREGEKRSSVGDDDDDEGHQDRDGVETVKRTRKNSKSNLLKEFNGGYDSVKRILQKTISMDRASNKIQKPPRRFLTLNNRKSHCGEFDDHEDSVSLKLRRAGSTGDLATNADDTCSLPDKIPTTPPPKKTTSKKTSSFINLMRSNLKF